MNELQISEATYYRHVKRIMNEDAKIWDKVPYGFCKVQG